MRRLLLLLLTSVLGCTPDDSGTPSEGGHDDGGGDPSADDQGDDEAKEACENPTTPPCPFGFGYQYYSGDSNEDLVVIDLEQEGEPVCDGYGRYLAAESLAGADLIGVHVTHNAHCTFGCFAGCNFTNVCWAEGLDGPSCAHACTTPDLDEAGCVELVRECLAEDGIECAG